MIKKLLIAALALGLLITPSVVLAHKSDEDKVALCHATHSVTNPFVVQDVNANEVQSHEANGDFPYKGAADIHSDAARDWCNDNQPGDLCANIQGKQATIPEGMEADGNECVDIPPTDVCPNIEGVQTVVPDGMELKDGKCVEKPVTPPVVSPTIPGFEGK